MGPQHIRLSPSGPRVKQIFTGPCRKATISTRNLADYSVFSMPPDRFKRGANVDGG
jgi:hypothetical protein